jgi:gluconolactonase
MASKPTYTDIIDYNLKQAHTGDISYARSLPEKPCFISYDPSFRKLIGPSPKLTLVEERKDKFAHEAGVYIKSTNKNYFTSNYQSNRSIETYSIDCTTHEITEDHFPDVVTANGACHYNDKILYCCQGDFNTPSALVLADPSTGKSEIVINNFYGREFNSINDVVIHHNTGDIWFTDPTYGYEQAFRPSPMLPSQVYRFRPSTGQIWCVADGFIQCNGLCFSPDYKTMYITDTAMLQAHAGPGNGQNFSANPRLPSSIYAYDVVDEGRVLVNRRMFAFCDKGVPDGIKCDEMGNVY